MVNTAAKFFEKVLEHFIIYSNQIPLHFFQIASNNGGLITEIIFLPYG